MICENNHPNGHIAFSGHRCPKAETLRYAKYEPLKITY